MSSEMANKSNFWHGNNGMIRHRKDRPCRYVSGVDEMLAALALCSSRFCWATRVRLSSAAWQPLLMSHARLCGLLQVVPMLRYQCWRTSGRSSVCPWSASSGLQQNAFLWRVHRRAVALVCAHQAYEQYSLPSGSELSSEGCIDGWFALERTSVSGTLSCHLISNIWLYESDLTALHVSGRQSKTYRQTRGLSTPQQRRPSALLFYWFPCAPRHQHAVCEKQSLLLRTCWSPQYQIFTALDKVLYLGKWSCQQPAVSALYHNG